MLKSKLIKFKDKKGNSYPYLYIDDQSGLFYVRKRVGLLVKSLSLETKDFNQARSISLNKALELNSSKNSKRNYLIFKDFYELLIEEKKANAIKLNTLNRIDIIWRLSLEPFWGMIRPEDINQDLITNFINWHKRIRAGVQFVNVFKYLGNIFNVMIKRGYLPADKKPDLEIPKDEARHHLNQKGRFVSDDDVKSILKHSNDITKLLILIAYCTGMRKMEIVSLSKNKIKKIDKRYIISLSANDTKTGQAREIPLPEVVNGLIENRLKTKSSLMFPMITNDNRAMSSQLIDKGWNEAKSLAGIKTRTRFHDLRHTCASNLAKQNINPAIACTILGMSLVTYQKKYLKLSINDLIIVPDTLADKLGVIL